MLRDRQEERVAVSYQGSGISKTGSSQERLLIFLVFNCKLMADD